MKANLELIYGSFLFVEDLSLGRGQPPKEVDLSGRNDSFKAHISRAIVFGQITSDVKAEDIIATIKNEEFRAATSEACGFKKSMTFNDLNDANVEIIEATFENDDEPENNDTQDTSITGQNADTVILDEVNDDGLVNEPPTETEPEVAPNVSEENPIAIPLDSLREILKGNVTQVAIKVKEAATSSSDIEKLIELEKANKNRATILSLLKDQ